jgi:hypothetical protein
MKNRCAPGGTLDPLTPNSIRHEDTSGSPFWLVVGVELIPDRARRVLESACEFGTSGVRANSGRQRRTANMTTEFSLVIRRASSPRDEPPGSNRGARPNPFGTTGHSGLRAGDYSSPAPMVETGKARLTPLARHVTHLCHRSRAKRVVATTAKPKPVKRPSGRPLPKARARGAAPQLTHVPASAVG